MERRPEETPDTPPGFKVEDKRHWAREEAGAANEVRRPVAVLPAARAER